MKVKSIEENKADKGDWCGERFVILNRVKSEGLTNKVSVSSPQQTRSAKSTTTAYRQQQEERI